VTPDETAEMMRLCVLIQTEQNRDKFLDYMKQLNALLARKDERLKKREGLYK
jgi:hypothetical protein